VVPFLTLTTVMRFSPKFFLLQPLVLIAITIISQIALADDVLFIGNSFTHGHDGRVKDHGGVPAIFQAIAVGKGKETSVTMAAVSGKDWTFHLASEETTATIASKVWDKVVIQDFSSKPTRTGNRENFFRSGEALAELIWATSPEAEIILYRTWARKPGHSWYQDGDRLAPFRDFNDMDVELEVSYRALQALLTGKNPGKSVRIARVGDAVSLCVRETPGIDLYDADLHHLNPVGSYLSALVFYATVFQESPEGAVREFPAFEVDAETANHLQEIAGKFR